MKKVNVVRPKNENNFLRLLLSLKLAEYKIAAESFSEIVFFLVQYSFLFEDTEKVLNSCGTEQSQLYALQENRGLGARYLDPRYSMWISTDPALGEYIPQAPVNDEIRRNNQNLPGMGGIFNHINSNLYHYAGNNPVCYTDPNGQFLTRQFFAGLSQFGGGICEEIGAAGIEVSTAGIGTGAAVFFGLDGLYNIVDGFCKMTCACADVEWDGLLNTLTTELLVGAGVEREFAEAIGTFVDLIHDIVDIVMTPNKADVAKVLDKASKVQRFFVINKNINNFNALHDGFTLLYDKILKPIIDNANKSKENEND